MDSERNAITKDLASHVLGQFRPAMVDASKLLDTDRERAMCAMFVLADVAAWAGVFFAKHHGSPEGEQARIAMTIAVLDLTKDIVAGDALGPTTPDHPQQNQDQGGVS